VSTFDASILVPAALVFCASVYGAYVTGRTSKRGQDAVSQSERDKVEVNWYDRCRELDEKNDKLTEEVQKLTDDLRIERNATKATELASKGEIGSLRDERDDLLRQVSRLSAKAANGEDRQ